MGVYCGRCRSPTLDHRDRTNRRAADSLIATADDDRCPRCGACGTDDVAVNGDLRLIDCLGARGHMANATIQTATAHTARQEQAIHTEGGSNT